MLTFETYRKRGKYWEYLGEREAESSRGAALSTSYVHNLRVVAVRVAGAGSSIKKQVYRFNSPAAVHHGR